MFEETTVSSTSRCAGHRSGTGQKIVVTHYPVEPSRAKEDIQDPSIHTKASLYSLASTLRLGLLLKRREREVEQEDRKCSAS